MIPTTRPPATNSIGFLRLSLAALVVYSHAYYLGGFGAEPLWALSGETLIAGSLAVQAFFVLSGRLVAESWLRRPEPGPFLLNRALRILPALWLCLAVVAFALTPFLHLLRPAPGATWSGLAPDAFAYVWQNLFLPRTRIAIGPYPAGGDWNGSLWTLFYEGAAYLMVAGLGLLSLLQKRRAAGVALLAGMLLLGTLWRIAPDLLPHPLPRLFDTDGKQLTLFFFSGMLWALHPNLEPVLAGRRSGPLCAFLLCAGIVAGAHGVCGPWLLAPALFWLARALPLRDFERRIGGDYSYGLYLYGYPVQQTLACLGVPALGFTAWLLLGLGLAGALAALSWHLIEKPALSLKNRRAPRPSTV